jgi:hypothetical protein
MLALGQQGLISARWLVTRRCTDDDRNIGLLPVFRDAPVSPKEDKRR